MVVRPFTVISVRGDVRMVLIPRLSETSEALDCSGRVRVGADMTGMPSKMQDASRTYCIDV